MAAVPDKLDRLLRPRSIAVIGGGAWCSNVITTCQNIGFKGDIWPVHPTKQKIEGHKAYAHIKDLPTAPDASFIGVNRHATIECLSSLSERRAGGAVCFASGFAEASAELADGADVQAALLQAAGDMPFLGPNCYGFLNYLDAAALWPDQHGGEAVDSGVAIITQSSNIAINLTMQNRAVPLAYVVTAGNQAQVDLAEIGMSILRDPRVTALGIHIEGINNIRRLEELSNLSHELRKPICALKVGLSDQAQLASVSHTASLAGSHTGAAALLARLGIAQPTDLATFLELLKIFHVAGPLRSNAIASASCSGGEASLMADLGIIHNLSYPTLSSKQSNTLRQALGPKVALANPLDYHTYIWPNRDAMTQTFTALFDADIAMGLVVLDLPRSDRCSVSDWDIALEAVVHTAKASSIPVGIIASLPDTMPEDTAKSIMDHGVTAFSGMDHALRAISLAQKHHTNAPPILLPKTPINIKTLAENDAKARLARFGLPIPKSDVGTHEDDIVAKAITLRPPWVLKGLGHSHKSEAGAVKISIRDEPSLRTALKNIKSDAYLIEEMVQKSVIELLLAVTLDPVHGYVLTLGAGGTQTELLQDTASLILPVDEAMVDSALSKLRCAPLFDGYRGAQPIDRKSLWQAIVAVQNYVIAHHGQVQEIEINPLICTHTRAIAVDALIVQGDAP